MTWTATHAESGEIHFPKQADHTDSYECIDCGEPVQFVRSHERDPQGKSKHRVSAHFRRHQCACGSGDGSISGGGGGGEGGGGTGESELHKRRKRAALQEATERFPAAEYGTEQYIGQKRADAFIEFEDSHQEYGRGLVIEYQHKNENKDIEATQTHFAEHEYTTVWLWEAQFDFSSEIPSIDLFGGNVYTPWPDAVPQQEAWTGSREAEYVLQGLISDLPASHGASTNIVPIPEEFIIDRSVTIYRSQDWDELFEPPDVSNLLVEGLVGELPVVERPEAHVAGHWYLKTPRELWRSTAWSRRFRGSVDVEMPEGTPTLECDIPLLEWITTETGNNPCVAAIREAYDRGRTNGGHLQRTHCQNCGAKLEISHYPDLEKMSSWSTNCGECSAFTTLYNSDRDDMG